jgi:two-component system, cell cycle sensor histidine kinase and response regulator CckA
VTIRRSLVLSLLTILLGFAVNQGVSQWAAAQRRDATAELDRLRARQVSLDSLQRQISELTRQVELASQLDGAGTPHTTLPELRDILGRGRDSIVTDLRVLAGLSDARQLVDAQRLADDFRELSREWDDYVIESPQAGGAALGHLMQAQQGAKRLLSDDIPRMRQVENEALSAAATDVRRIDTRASIVSWAVFALTLAVVAVLATMLPKRLTRGFAQLREANARIGDLDFGHRVAAEASDEFGALAASFNEMAAKLERAHGHLTMTHDGLKSSEERYRSLVEHARHGVYRSRREEQFVDVNPSLVAMLGHASEDDLLALNLRDVYADPGERARALDTFRQGHDGGTIDVRWRRRDGTTIIVRLSGRPSSTPGESDILEVIAEDVTDRLAIAAQLRDTQKMQAIGRLAGGVAHDFNNLLTIIKGHTERLIETAGVSQPAKLRLEEVQRAADRAAALTTQLLAFSRRQVLAPRVISLNDVVRNLQSVLRPLLTEKISLAVELDPAVWAVRADPSQIAQVVVNLAVNARDAMPQGGHLLIRTENLPRGDGRLREGSPLASSPLVALSVQDTGVGMDEATRAHIFEPFFTTKEVGQGTGLGLSTAYGIVRQSGGEILVETAPREGSTFTVVLPRVFEEPPQPQERSFSSRSERSSILIVDDDEELRGLVKNLLEPAGYTVIAAAPDQAEKTVDRLPDGSVLIMDAALDRPPRRLISALTARSNRLRLLLLSPTGDHDDAVRYPGVTHVAALRKPFTVGELTNAVHKLLASEVTPDPGAGGPLPGITPW